MPIAGLLSYTSINMVEMDMSRLQLLISWRHGQTGNQLMLRPIVVRGRLLLVSGGESSSFGPDRLSIMQHACPASHGKSSVAVPFIPSGHSHGVQVGSFLLHQPSRPHSRIHDAALSSHASTTWVVVLCPKTCLAASTVGSAFETSHAATMTG